MTNESELGGKEVAEQDTPCQPGPGLPSESKVEDSLVNLVILVMQGS